MDLRSEDYRHGLLIQREASSLEIVIALASQLHYLLEGIHFTQDL